MQKSSVLNTKLYSRLSYNSVSTKKEELQIPEDIEFDIRFLNMFNLFFGLKRAVFTKKKTAAGSRDLFEEFEKNFMASMKVLSCKAFDIDSSITKRYCKLIDDVLVLNKYVRHNPKKVKKISNDLLTALDKNLNPLKDFWQKEEEKEENKEKMKKFESIKKSLDFGNLNSRIKQNILQPRGSINSIQTSRESRREVIPITRRMSVEKYPKYRYSTQSNWERGTQSGKKYPKNGRDFFRMEGEKFRSNLQKRLSFGDFPSSPIKPNEEEDGEKIHDVEKDMQLISLISIEESVSGDDLGLTAENFNEKLDVRIEKI